MTVAALQVPYPFHWGDLEYYFCRLAPIISDMAGDAGSMTVAALQVPRY